MIEYLFFAVYTRKSVKTGQTILKKGLVCPKSAEMGQTVSQKGRVCPKKCENGTNNPKKRIVCPKSIIDSQIVKKKF